MPRIQISPEYLVPATYIDLNDGEILCLECRGSKEVVAAYTRLGPSPMRPCPECRGKGKIAYCATCGQQRDIIKHQGQPWMDECCLPCIVADARFKALTAE